jgi:biofilm PGA synthesis N-glycosyltransferase PgaC
MVSLVLLSAHFMPVAIYYQYLKRHHDDEWDLDLDNEYNASMVVVVPTWNESGLIERRLEDLKKQSYRSENLDVVVVDSGSTDGTAEIARRWNTENKGKRINVQVVEEPVRRGKISAMNYVLNRIPEGVDIILFTDADCTWRSGGFAGLAKYFADSKVGGVTCSIYPAQNDTDSFEHVYRRTNNFVRVAESKLWTTPIFHGPFAAFRLSLLRAIGGIPSWVWADDSGPATLLGLMGHRCIAVPDIVAYEYVPRKLRINISRKVRRARHLVHLFVHVETATKGMDKKVAKTVRRILMMEKVLHLLIPWFLIAGIFVLLLDSVIDPSLATIILVCSFLVGLCSQRLRMWVMTQGVLAYALISNTFGKELLIWEPVRDALKERHAQVQRLTPVARGVLHGENQL